MPSVNDDGWLSAGPTDPDEVRGFYDAWAERYDADLAAWDYRAPRRIAASIAGHADLGATVLDAGCGTGLSGRALRDAGCRGELVGLDLSEASLAIARSSGAYTRIVAGSLDDPLEFDDDTFGAVACVGVLTYVPDVEACWRELCRVTRPGGVVAFTQREDTWADRECRAVLERLAAGGLWSPIEISEPAAYLPDTGDDLATIGAHYVTCRVS